MILGLALRGDVNLPDVCWKSSTMESKVPGVCGRKLPATTDETPR